MAFQSPPTWAELILVDQKSGKTAFNPIWLNWFLSLTQNISAAGPVTSVGGTSPIVSSGGPTPVLSLSIGALLPLIQTIASWTPVDNSGAALAFTAVSANYTKIGNMIFSYFTLVYPVTASGAAASIGGLPVTVANANYAQIPSIVAVTAGLTVVLVPTKNTITAAFDIATTLAAVTNLQLSGSTVKCLLAYPAA